MRRTNIGNNPRPSSLYGFVLTSGKYSQAKIQTTRQVKSNAANQVIGCQMAAVDVVAVVDAFDVFDTQPARSLRRACATCAIGAFDNRLDNRLDTQLDRFFDFPNSRLFSLRLQQAPQQRYKKNNYVIIFFIKSLPREVVLYVYYTRIV